MFLLHHLMRNWGRCWVFYRFPTWCENTFVLILLISSVISRFVEPVRLFPASVEAHRAFTFQELVNSALPVSWSTGKTLLLGVSD